MLVGILGLNLNPILQKEERQVEEDLTADLQCRHEEGMLEVGKLPQKELVLAYLDLAYTQLSES